MPRCRRTVIPPPVGEPNLVFTFRVERQSCCATVSIVYPSFTELRHQPEFIRTELQFCAGRDFYEVLLKKGNVTGRIGIDQPIHFAVGLLDLNGQIDVWQVRRTIHRNRIFALVDHKHIDRSLTGRALRLIDFAQSKIASRLRIGFCRPAPVPPEPDRQQPLRVSLLIQFLSHNQALRKATEQSVRFSCWRPFLDDIWKTSAVLQ